MVEMQHRHLGFSLGSVLFSVGSVLFSCGGDSDTSSTFGNGPLDAGPYIVKGELTDRSVVIGSCEFEARLGDASGPQVGGWNCPDNAECYDLSAFSVTGENCHNERCPVCVSSAADLSRVLRCPEHCGLFTELTTPKHVVCQRGP